MTAQDEVQKRVREIIWDEVKSLAREILLARISSGRVILDYEEMNYCLSIAERFVDAAIIAERFVDAAKRRT